MSAERRAARLLALLCASVAPLHAAEMSFVGNARNDNGDTLYLEQHKVSGSCQEGVFRPEAHQVDYQQPGRDQSFATKALEYRDSVVRPVVDFRQPQFDESLSIQYPAKDTLAINWQTPTGETRTFEAPFSDSVVVDAGFDNFVRRHWGAVTAGKSVEFRFLGPTRGEHYAFVLEPTNSSEVAADHVFQIRPTSLVLRLLMDPIVLGYDTNGALTDYYGLTNIRKDENSNYTAHIQYSVAKWPDCELTP